MITHNYNKTNNIESVTNNIQIIHKLKEKIKECLLLENIIFRRIQQIQKCRVFYLKICKILKTLSINTIQLIHLN